MRVVIIGAGGHAQVDSPRKPVCGSGSDRDEGSYLCSIQTMYRILATQREMRE
jgi:hypothetical protein